MARLFRLVNDSEQEGTVGKKVAHNYSSQPGQDPERVPATAFKDSCLSLIDRVCQTREEIVVTRHGRPVAKLVAFDEETRPIFGSLAGSVTIHGDIIEPVDEDWDAEG